MIRLQDRDIGPALRNSLNSYQLAIDITDGFGPKVAKAKDDFSAKNTKTNAIFMALKSHLRAMCSGAVRCHFCEDSAADEVEHFKPKSFYPELTFRWENYYYVCGICNLAKGSKFGVIDSAGNLVEFKSIPRQPAFSPPVGTGAPLDPRLEDANSFATLDIVGATFRFVPTATSALMQTRTEFTIRFLGLNRDVLLRARREAYRNYLAQIRMYVSSKESGATVSELIQIRDAIREMQHPSVWRQMISQRHQITHLANLFVTAPEALSW